MISFVTNEVPSQHDGQVESLYACLWQNERNVVCFGEREGRISSFFLRCSGSVNVIIIIRRNLFWICSFSPAICEEDDPRPNKLFTNDGGVRKRRFDPSSIDRLYRKNESTNAERQPEIANESAVVRVSVAGRLPPSVMSLMIVPGIVPSRRELLLCPRAAMNDTGINHFQYRTTPPNHKTHR
jgi:hypothetical protein